MKKSVRKIASLCFLIAMGVSFASCSSDDGPAINMDDNGTGVGNNGGNGNEVLAPEKEKQFLEETGRLFVSYFKADDVDEMLEIADQVGTVGAGDLSVLENALFIETLRTINRSYTYSYYDVLIKASACKGIYQASYGGEWRKTGDSDRLQMSFTDWNNTTWQLTVNASTTSKGTVHVSNDESWVYNGSYWNGNYYESDYDVVNKDYYLEVPEQVTATMTHQNVKKVDVNVNINELAPAGNAIEPSAISRAKGSAEMTFAVASGTYTVSSVFSFSPNESCKASTVIAKNGTKLLDVQGETGAVDLEDGSVNSVKLKVDVLGRIQLFAQSDDVPALQKALDDADDNYNSEQKVKECSDKVNSLLTAYCTNNGGSAQQATVKTAVLQEGYGQVSYYEIKPVLAFSDGSTYSLEEYFKETDFVNVIKDFNDLLRQVTKKF